MGINTDLNITPYFDDFDETKQYNRVLFAAGRAVQARELTQLQTILQNQVERFGSNIFKEGTVISGINITERSDISYVKLLDTENFPDPTIYRPSGDTKYFLVGESTGLRAEIVYADNGFETRAPNLKTFYIKYLNTAQSGEDDVKDFEQGEVLGIVDENGLPVTTPNEDGDMTVTVATVSEHVGRSFGVSINEGIIYQRGHFIFADEQFVIVSKYTNVPNDVSIGFSIEENIITASQDSSLLDNAQGFNNHNAPGADRLQLKPILAAVAIDEEPEGFFRLIRYERGNATTIRDVTQFNTIATEMARRTYEESGNYVVRGMNVSLEQETAANTTTTYAVVGSGKAYSFGYEINNIAKKYLPLEPSDATQTKNNQSTGIDYGAYYEFVWGSFSGEDNNVVLDSFQFDGTRYDLRNSANGVIGSCCVRNITPGEAGSSKGRLHVYAVAKNAGQENEPVAKIGNTPVVSTLRSGNQGAALFNSGKKNLFTADDVVFTRRVRKSVSGNTSITIEATPEQQPLTSNIFAVDATNNLISVVSAIPSGSNTVIVTLDANDASYLYYDVIETGVDADDLEEIDMYVNSTFDPSTNISYIGVPNAVSLLSVIDSNGAGEDITSRFRLVNNQKEGYYDISYIQLKSGESVPGNNNLQIKAKVLRRTSSVGSGFLSINSYNNVDARYIRPYTAKDGITYDLLSSYDFRPYATPWVSYSISAAGAETATPVDLSIGASVSPSVAGFITADLEFYVGRYDAVVVDETGDFNIVQGTPAENPVPPKVNNAFVIGEVYIPGNNLNITGQDPVKVRKKNVRNYTMEDIGHIDKRVDRLVETVSLSLLEARTKDLFIPDANGLNRFKNGILVDGFKNLKTADLRDPEFSSAIDKGYFVGMPKVKQFPIDLKFSTGNNVNSGYPDVITLADSGSVQTLINQPFATDVRNAVSNFYNYKGQAIIDPQFDTTYDTVQNPAINLEVDIATPLLDFVENLQEFIPLTSTDVNVITNDVNLVDRISTTNITTVTEDELSFDVVNDNSQTVGSFVTDIAFNPYMQSQEVRILVTGLRPNTRHYFYFDQRDVNAHIIPGEIVSEDGNVFDVRDVQPAAREAGSAVRSDSNGVLSAVFTIPEATFFVGEVDLEISDVSQYESIKSGGTSYSRISYRAYNFSVGQSSLNASTRTVDFDTTTTVTTTQNVTTRFIPANNNDITTVIFDPIAQTFFIKRGMADGASTVYINQLLLYFQTKSLTNGATVEIREVVNGYPSSQVLPFGRKHLTPAQINTSEDGSIATTVTFDNPVKCSVEKEYCFVVIPDANDPNYLLYVSRVGGFDLASGEPVVQDWGDGVLFTSTNNRAWQSYQDEDLKFEIRRLEFVDTEGTADLVPNDVEHFTISNTVSRFRKNELAYAVRPVSYAGVGISGRTFTVPQASVDFNVGDYVRLTQGDDDFISRITSINSAGGETVVTMRGRQQLDESSSEQVAATLVTAGRVSYFNNRKPTEIHLRESSARATARFTAGDTLIGYRSGATTTINSIDDVPLSYIQPLILIDNTVRTTANATLYNGIAVDRPLPLDKNTYILGDTRTVPSKSNIVAGTSSEDFKIRVAMSNRGFQTTTPVLDSKLSILNAYQYDITDSEATTSKYISKEVVLQEDMNAIGLKVLLSAYRPQGTVVDVYARFTYESNSDAQSDWAQLANENPEMFSNLSNTRDYREFEYNLDDESNEFTSFQLKIVMRHMTDQEKLDANITVETGPNLFPHIHDYRAIAVT
jgi:hypothetical protein